MKAYKVTAKDAGEVLAVRYGGTAAHSKELRDELMDKYTLKKKDVEIEDYEIPTPKAELLGFINSVSAEADAGAA